MENTSFPFDQLPPELQTQVFLALDLPSLAAATRVSTTWHALIDEQVMWKLKCMRDYPHYVGDVPTPDKDCVIPDETTFRVTMEELEEAVSNGNEGALLRLIQLIQHFTRHRDEEEEEEEEEENEAGQTSSPESHRHRDEPGGDQGQERESKKRKQNSTKESSDNQEESRWQVVDWKDYYRKCRACINLSGRWIGEYGSHGKELIQVDHKGFQILATKITGDANVPAGKPTFRMRMVEKGDKGKGEMHLADTGYLRPRWGRAFIIVSDKNNFVVKWFYGSHPTQHYDTYYERVKEADSLSVNSTTPLLPAVPSPSCDRMETDSEHQAISTEEEQHPKPTKREETVGGFAFRLVYVPQLGQMKVVELDDSDDEALEFAENEEREAKEMEDDLRTLEALAEREDDDDEEEEEEEEDDEGAYQEDETTDSDEGYTELPDLRDDHEDGQEPQQDTGGGSNSTPRSCGFQ